MKVEPLNSKVEPLNSEVTPLMSEVAPLNSEVALLNSEVAPLSKKTISFLSHTKAQRRKEAFIRVCCRVAQRTINNLNT